MKTPIYILVDFENIQPKTFAHLRGHMCKVRMFVGASQTRIPLDLAQEFQALGENAEYVRISGSGRNALDFHIAFTLGQLSQANPNGVFYIVSKDGGFDPLVNYMKAKGFQVARAKEIAEIPILLADKAKAPKDKVESVVQNLRIRGSSRPRKLKTLKNTINALYGNTLSESDLADLIKRLKDDGHMVVEGDRVTYNL